MRLNSARAPVNLTRDRLREVAEELFAAHGIGGVTTRALAEQAGDRLDFHGVLRGKEAGQKAPTAAEDRIDGRRRHVRTHNDGPLP